MQVNSELLKKIKNAYLCLEEYLILYSKYHNTKWLDTYRPMDIHYYKLRKNKLLGANNVITDAGMATVKSIENSGFEISEAEKSFEEWWKLYPTDDRVKHFPVSRRFKTNKRRARQLYLQLLREGVKPETLKTALNNEIEFRIASSVTKNHLTFLQNPATWLYNHTFETWSDTQLNVEETSNYGKDIK